MVATRPGGAPAPDAFVPCPVCGGKIHPIAGRCKHCKSDLVSLRTAQAIPTAVTAVASTPTYAAPAAHAPYAPVAPITGAAVQSAPIPQAQGTLPASGPLNAAAFAPVGVAAMAMPTSLPLAPTYAQAVPTAGVVVRGSPWSRRWPIVVVVLAAAAIVVSIVLLVMPESASAGSRMRGAPPPTPDHMNTNPIPQGPDPWGMAPPAQPAPSDPDDDDLWGPRGGGGGGGGGLGGFVPAPPSDQYLATLGTTFCKRLAACSTSGGLTDDDCNQFGSFLGSTLIPGVDTCGSYDRQKASSCLSTVRAFPCTTTGDFDQDQMKALVAGIPDCIDACRP